MSFCSGSICEKEAQGRGGSPSGSPLTASTKRGRKETAETAWQIHVLNPGCAATQRHGSDAFPSSALPLGYKPPVLSAKPTSPYSCEIAAKAL